MAENKIEPKFNIHSNYTKVNIINPYRFATGASYEPETLNYMASVGIADDSTTYYPGTAQQITGNGFYMAIDTFVKSLKTEGIFSKLKAVYPLIGGNASAHSWNLRDITQFKMDWYGAGAHTKTGFKGDGISAYGDTNFNQLNNSQLNNESFGFYNRTNTSENSIPMGINAQHDTYIYANLNGVSYSRIQSNINNISFSVSDALGFYQTSVSGSCIASKNNVFYTGSGGQSLSNYSFYIGARNSAGNPELFASSELSYAFMGEGLTESELTSHLNAVQQLQIDLGRAV